MLKSSEIVFNLSISNLSRWDFKLAKSAFLAKDDVSTPVVFFKSAFIAYLDKFTLTLMSPANGSNGLRKYWLIFIQDNFILRLFYQSSY